MKKQRNNYTTVIKEICDTSDFDRLRDFDEPKQWEGMTESDRELLGSLFVKVGEKRLVEGDGQASRFFDIASQVAPFAAEVFHKQGIAYASNHENIRCLINATDKFKKAVEINTKFFEAWYRWGDALAGLGVLCSESARFVDADEKFRTAERLLPNNIDTQAEFFWKWGVMWLMLSQLSGEAYDCNIAIKKFKEAETLGCRDAAFWNDYGKALLDMDGYLDNEEFAVEAVRLLRKSVAESSDYFEGWQNLAFGLQILYERIGQEKLFLEAYESFSKAARINADKFDLWLRWGQLLANSGKTKKHVNRLEMSLAKFSIAKRCQPDNHIVYRLWGEALTYLGSFVDSLEMLRHGESKIIESLELSPESPMSWYCYGVCLNERGKYFDDEGYFEQAIERFKYGMMFVENNAIFSYGIGMSYLLMGEMEHDVVLLGKASQYFKRAEVSGEVPSHFWNDWGVALMRQGELFHDRKYFEDAVSKFEVIIEGSPTGIVDPEWLYNYGCALDSLGEFSGDEEHYERAIQVLTQVLVIDSTHYDACYNLAVALTHLGEIVYELDYYYKAIELYNVVVSEDDEDDMAWNEWGMALLSVSQMIKDPAQPQASRGFRDDAEAKLLNAVSLGNIPALYNIAALYSLDGNYDAAIYYLERSFTNGGLPPVEEMLQDEWFDGLNDTTVFLEFLRSLPEEIL